MTSVENDEETPHEADTATADTTGAGDRGDDESTAATPGDREAAAGSERANDSGASGADDSTIAALIAELEDGVATDDQVAALREALNVPSRSSEVRLRHVQSRMDDFAAYVEVLEEAIDEHGPPAEAFTRLQEDLAAVQAELETVQAAVDEEQAAVSQRLDALETDLDALDDRLGDVTDVPGELETIRAEREAAIDEVKTETEALDEDLDQRYTSLQTTVDDLRAAVEEFESMQTELADIFGESAMTAESTTDTE